MGQSIYETFRVLRPCNRSKKEREFNQTTKKIFNINSYECASIYVTINHDIGCIANSLVIESALLPLRIELLLRLPYKLATQEFFFPAPSHTRVDCQLYSPSIVTLASLGRSK